MRPSCPRARLLARTARGLYVLPRPKALPGPNRGALPAHRPNSAPGAAGRQQTHRARPQAAAARAATGTALRRDSCEGSERSPRARGPTSGLRTAPRPVPGRSPGSRPGRKPPTPPARRAPSAAARGGCGARPRAAASRAAEPPRPQRPPSAPSPTARRQGSRDPYPLTSSSRDGVT